MAWLNFNDSLNNLKGQLSTFANNVLADDEEVGVKSSEGESNWEEVCKKQETEIANLRKLNEELSGKLDNVNPQNSSHDFGDSWNHWNDSTGTKTNIENNASTVATKVEQLQKENEELNLQLNQLDLEHQQNLSEVLKLKEQLQDENYELKDEIEQDKKYTSSLQKKYQTKIAELLKQIDDNKNVPNQNNHDALNELEQLKINIKSFWDEQQESHQKELINYLTNLNNATTATEEPSEKSTEPSNQESSNIKEELLSENSPNLNSKADNNQEALSKCKASNIELVHNNNCLTNELRVQSRALIEYETELNELAKNNELLVTELEAYKSNSNLQTISESNEDKIISLEDELETAKKQIRDLESNVDNTSKSKADIDKLNDYQELLHKYDQLQIDFDTLSKDYAKSCEDLKFTEQLVEDLKVALERKQSAFEQAEFQLTENFTINLDSLVEENKLYSENNLRLKNDIECLSKQYEQSKESLLQEKDNNLKLDYQIQGLTEKLESSKISETTLKLQLDTLNKEVSILTEKNNDLMQSLEQQKDFEDLKKNFDEISCSLKNTVESKDSVIEELQNKLTEQLAQESNSSKDSQTEELQQKYNETLQHLQISQQQIQELSNMRNELINTIQVKHQESLKYHSEIQRLAQVLKDETERANRLDSELQKLNTTTLIEKNSEIEKLTDQNDFLSEKCKVLSDNLILEQQKLQKVLSEVPSTSEKEAELTKKLTRLQNHLIEVEERCTQDLLQTEQKNAELQDKLNEIELREKNASTLYTSVSIRTNQQVEVLQNQLQLVSNQREELRRKISDAEDTNNKQAAALVNLQCVLEQFQKEKSNDVRIETERIRREISVERQIQNELKQEIASLRSQLDESKQGLQAAARLSDQLEQSKKLVQALKEEVAQAKDTAKKSEDKLKQLLEQTDCKVDKSLIKNLILGYVSSNLGQVTKDQSQILKIIATVLDFNQQDHDKVNVNNKQSNSWWNSILASQAGQSVSQESLSQAFVRFLENESKPVVVPSLLSTNEPDRTVSSNSKSSVSGQSPIVLSEIVLPTFDNFSQSRNSSSILKDVLKDNT